jgi:2-dehydro-3-deoxyphosphogluconate aldolase/(4S)-4-hydroxy-2-oxoglutarate aldolase
MPDNFFRIHLTDTPVIAILRGLSPEVTVDLAHRCWDAGIRLVEVPAQDDAGLTALRAAADAARTRGTFVGAGTVYTPTAASLARRAGAAFLVAPGIDADTVRFAQRSGLPYLPGVTTASDVQTALSLGLRVLKLFPAGPLGPEWVTALHGPFPEVDLVAVGGVNADNAPDFLRAGAIGVGVGGALSHGNTIETLAHLSCPGLPAGSR